MNNIIQVFKAAFVSVVKEIKKTFYILEGVQVRKEN